MRFRRTAAPGGALRLERLAAGSVELSVVGRSRARPGRDTGHLQPLHRPTGRQCLLRVREVVLSHPRGRGEIGVVNGKLGNASAQERCGNKRRRNAKPAMPVPELKQHTPPTTTARSGSNDGRAARPAFRARMCAECCHCRHGVNAAAGSPHALVIPAGRGPGSRPGDPEALPRPVGQSEIRGPGARRRPTICYRLLNITSEEPTFSG